jgi:hypothetical protein
MEKELRTQAFRNPHVRLARIWFACRLIDLAQMAALLAANRIAMKLGRAARLLVPEAEVYLKP